jgi:hypothetical protein
MLSVFKTTEVTELIGDGDSYEYALLPTRVTGVSCHTSEETSFCTFILSYVS